MLDACRKFTSPPATHEYAMTRFRLLGYFIREALVNMSRNKLLNIIAIGMIAVSLAIFGIFLLIFINLSAVAQHWSETVDVITYLQDGISEDQRDQLDARLHTFDTIEEVQYISKEEALSIFKQRLGEHEYLIDSLDANPLPASFEIRLKGNHKDLASIRNVVEMLQGVEYIEDIQYEHEWIENLTLIITMLKFVGMFLGIFLFLTVIFIISNTIKLTLYAREEELTIMKFIGATESFIKGPFLAEGILRGFLGSLLSLAVLYALHKLFTLLIMYSAQSLLIFSAISFLSWAAIIGIAVLGSALGWCGSLLTLHKYLKTF